MPFIISKVQIYFKNEYLLTVEVIFVLHKLKTILDKLPLKASKDGAWLELIILWGP